MRYLRAAGWRLLLVALLVLLPGVAMADSGIYIVKPGDNLARIAAANGTTVAALVRANGLPNADFVYAGQRLSIPGRSNPGITTQQAPAAPAASASAGSYTIQKGDTLAKIAARYGVSAAALARANNITNPDIIRVGMKLAIPGAAGSTAGSGTSAAAPSAATTNKPAAGTSSSATTTAKTGLRFVASISQQHCWLYNGNSVMYSWRCSTGRAGAPSMPGTYAVKSKIGRAWGSTWAFWMPYWLGIYNSGSLENGIHGLPYRDNGAKTWQGLVGTPITFGCVMLDDANAATLFNLAYIGMPVIIQR